MVIWEKLQSVSHCFPGWRIAVKYQNWEQQLVFCIKLNNNEKPSIPIELFVCQMNMFWLSKIERFYNIPSLKGIMFIKRLQQQKQQGTEMIYRRTQFQKNMITGCRRRWVLIEFDFKTIQQFLLIMHQSMDECLLLALERDKWYVCQTQDIFLRICFYIPKPLDWFDVFVCL